MRDKIEALPSNNDQNNSAGYVNAKGRKYFERGNKMGKGRPRGSRNKVTLAMENLLENESGALTRKAIEMGLNGDMGALRLCMDRLLPPRKERTIQLNIPPITTLQDTLIAVEAIATAVCAGEITPTEAMAMTKVIEVYGNTLEYVDILERLKKVEQAMKASQR